MSADAISLTPKHSQYYVRYRTEKKYINKNGKEVFREHFESTGVSVPAEGSTPEKIAKAEALAKKVGAHLKEMKGANPPSAVIHEERLKAFALEGAELSEHTFKNCVPVFLTHYSQSKRDDGQLVSTGAVGKMNRYLESIMEGLGTDEDKHPMLIPTHRLQTVVDGLPGPQAPYAIGLRLFYKCLVEKGVVLRAFNPADLVKVVVGKSVSHVPLSQLSVQRALLHMAGLKNGIQWQLLTLEGVYTSMRLGTACRVQLRPLDFVRPENPAKCAFLDTNEWSVEYFDSKGKKWVIEKLDAVFVEWLEPYISAQKLGPGDYLLPAFARLHTPPSGKWQKTMEKSGTKMVYVKHRTKKYCLTGYHALRVSQDGWLKSNQLIALTQKEIAKALKHGLKVHQTSYNSGIPNIAEQEKINAARPKFLPGNTDLNLRLFELRAEIGKCLVHYNSLLEREQALVKQIGGKNP